MRYGSVCSGIEAATVAWHPLGWEPAFFSEIEAFPRSVLAHHYPDVPCHGDFTTIGANEYGPIDLLVGGTPCQSFSIAGLRGGLDDDRGNLALEFLRLAQRKRSRWLVWENVPGVLSSNGGRDFGSILGALAELRYGFSWRILDAQYLGVAQRRRRVFVVGYLGDWRRAAAVLFERESLSGNPAPRREKREKVAAVASGSVDGGGYAWPADVAPTLNAAFGSKLGLEDQHIRGGQECLSVAQCLTAGTGQRYDPETETLIPTRGGGFDVATFNDDGTARTLTARHDSSPCHDRGPDVVAFAQNTRDEVRYIGGDGSIAGALAAEPGMKQTTYVRQDSAVRRLTPRECERLQGFPDDYTLVPHRGKPAADGPRYKALGNSMAVPVMRWIGERIQMVEDMT